MCFGKSYPRNVNGWLASRGMLSVRGGCRRNDDCLQEWEVGKVGFLHSSRSAHHGVELGSKTMHEARLRDELG